MSALLQRSTSSHRTRYRGPERRTGRGSVPTLAGARIATDLLVLGFATSLALVVGPAADVLLVPAGDAQALVAVVAAVLASATGVLALVRSRLGGDARMTYLGLALIVYGTIVVPTVSGTSRTISQEFAAGLSPLRVAGVLCALALLVVGLLAPDVDSGQTLWGPALLTAVSIGALAFLANQIAPWVPEAGLDEVILAAWLLTGVGYLVLGLRRRRQSLWRIGAGLVLVALAYALRMTTTDGLAYSLASIAAVRLVGLATLMAGVAPDVLAAFEARRVGDEQMRARWEDAERQVKETTDTVAERDHEIRNALAGLTGASYLLGRRFGSLKQHQIEALGKAVHTELERLKLLVGEGRSEQPRAYDVREVLTPLVTAEQQQGREVHLDVGPGLWAYGRSTVLAQIVVNLLTNCARHAPGALVLISACRQSDRVVVTVADDGPGLPPGEETRLLGRGERGANSGPGSGLGLHVSAKLAVDEGGLLRLLPSGEGRTGCTAALELPAADTHIRAIPSQRSGEQMAG